MTTVSPTPFPSSSFGNGMFPQHGLSPPRSRNNILRPSLRRQSPLSVLGHGGGFSADAPMIQRISIGDSSDDDIPVPMNFSALTKAILDDRSFTKARSPAPVNNSYDNHNEQGRIGSQWTKTSSGTPSRGVLRITRKSPHIEEHSADQSTHRVVQLSGSRRTPGLRRSLSSADAVSSGKVESAPQNDALITPAYALRTRPTISRAHSNISNEGPTSHSSTSVARSAGAIDGEYDYYPMSGQATSDGHGLGTLHDSTSRMTGVNDIVSGSSRVKRTNISRSVRGAPMRRPMHRPADEEDEASPNQGESASKRSPTPLSRENHPEPFGSGLRANQEQISVNDFAERHREKALEQLASRGSEHNASTKEPVVQSQPAAESRKPERLPAASLRSTALQDVSASRPVKEQPVFKIPALPPPLPYPMDQENEPPPTFKRNKAKPSGLLVQLDGADEISGAKQLKPLVDLTRPRSPPRQALLPRNINTPQRAAPPPPKMSVLETATATAGASTVKSKKTRKQISVNGKVFTFRGRLGKGGSSDVYRVMAENDKMFALKKVNLADCHEDIVRGYKGEIDLLQKLKGEERVVQLFDWEYNEAKQSLSVLMEIGESDFNNVLNRQLKPENVAPENVKLDMCFTRYYWREMLSCVSAIHARDIIHSDLKPSNFLLIQGRLKLIDFGIANAIDVDNTVNVHRETTVGTPNYMSPESLTDTNSDQRIPGGGHNASKLMKLGKPCDVWTLGCILYQMTYGRPPFAHIQNTLQRVMAIINPNHLIEFPERGIGGSLVPLSLREVLRSCLNRDSSKRPTVDQLLDDRDRFLNPDREIEKWTRDGAVPVTEHVLEQILTRIVERCRDPKRGIPTDEEVKVYPRAFLERVKEMQKA